MKFSDEQVQDILHRVELLISEHGWSKAEFYEKSGITSAQFSQWNTGATKPKVKSIGKMASALNVSPEFLVYGKRASMPFADNGKDLDVYDAINEKLPESSVGDLAEELQILKDRPDIRALLHVGAKNSPESVRKLADLLKTMVEG